MDTIQNTPQPKQRADQPWFITFWILLALALSAPIVNGIIDRGVFIFEISRLIEITLLLLVYWGLRSNSLVAKIVMVGYVVYFAFGLFVALL